MDNKDNTLIIGGDGNIGYTLSLLLESAGKSVFKTTRKRGSVSNKCFFLDLSEDVINWSPCVNEKFSTVIFCAAITSLERCHREPEFSRNINVINTVRLARRFIKEGAFIIFLSSNEVFNGHIPYNKTSDPTNAVTEYGKQKAESERELLKFKSEVLIIRLTKVITNNTSLLVNWLHKLKNGEKIYPFSDMVMAPVSIEMVTSLIIRLLKKKQPGIIHLSATEDITYVYAAEYIALKLGLDTRLIKAISYREAGLTFASKNTTLECRELIDKGLNLPLPTEALNYFLLKNNSES